MNDFTKEELNDLDYYLEHFLPTICNDDLEQKLIDLHYKIQSMIDNYCEHPENMSLQNMGDEWCVKCKRKIE